MTTNPNAHLHVVHRITAGTRHANRLPVFPENRKLCRVWTLMDAVALKEVGPVHNHTAFLEDRIHDYRLVGHALHYYSRLVETGKEVDVVLDFETAAERSVRLNRHAPAPVRNHPAPV